MALQKVKDKRFHMLADIWITVVVVARVEKHLQLCHKSAKNVCGMLQTERWPEI